MIFTSGGLINQQNIIGILVLSLVYLFIIFLLNYKEFQKKNKQGLEGIEKKNDFK